jgi:hypothetical protein
VCFRLVAAGCRSKVSPGSVQTERMKARAGV